MGENDRDWRKCQEGKKKKKKKKKKRKNESFESSSFYWFLSLSHTHTNSLFPNSLSLSLLFCLYVGACVEVKAFRLCHEKSKRKVDGGK